MLLIAALRKYMPLYVEQIVCKPGSRQAVFRPVELEIPLYKDT